MRWWPGLVLVVGCGSPEGQSPDAPSPDAPIPPLYRGPERAVRTGSYFGPRVCTYEYDDQDRLVGLVADFERDQFFEDRTVTYTWDGDVIVEMQIERPFSETGTATEVWSNDAEGTGSTWTETYSTNDVPTAVYVYALSARVALPRVLACEPLAAGRVYMGHANPSDFALPDQLLTVSNGGTLSWTYTYTGADVGTLGTRIRANRPDPLDTGIEYATRFTYDALGRVVAQSEDGEDPWWGAHTYLADGRFDENRYTHDDQTKVEAYTYDAGGNLLEVTTSLVDEGITPAIETYEYE